MESCCLLVSKCQSIKHADSLLLRYLSNDPQTVPNPFKKALDSLEHTGNRASMGLLGMSRAHEMQRIAHSRGALLQEAVG